MSAPEQVRLKRKRTENPPDQLVLARADDLESGSARKRIRYVIQEGSVVKAQDQSTIAKNDVKRIFHISRKRSANDLNDRDDHEGSKRPRSTLVPTIEEHTRQTSSISTSTPEAAIEDRHTAPLKRPGRGSALAVKPAPSKSVAVPVRSNIETLADSMHRFALEELAANAKPVTMGKPRMSPKQSQRRHEQRMASDFSDGTVRSSDDTAMDTEDDYVYDTYILSTGDGEDIQMAGDVAFLVINDDDDDYWHEVLAQSELEEHDDPDEEDENAEDHYGADYPEDELASDDEFNQNAYSFRPRANSDVEQWDHREQESEDDSASDDDLAEYDNFGNKGRMVKQWEEELGIHRPKPSQGA